MLCSHPLMLIACFAGQAVRDHLRSEFAGVLAGPEGDWLRSDYVEGSFPYRATADQWFSYWCDDALEPVNLAEISFHRGYGVLVELRWQPEWLAEPPGFCAGCGLDMHGRCVCELADESAF